MGWRCACGGDSDWFIREVGLGGFSRRHVALTKQKYMGELTYIMEE